MSYMRLSGLFGRLGNKFCYIDTDEDLAFQIFLKHKIAIKVMSTYNNDKCEYTVNICKVPKKYHAEFDKCMKELSNKMLITGHTDYEDFCINMIKQCKGELTK